MSDNIDDILGISSDPKPITSVQQYQSPDGLPAGSPAPVNTVKSGSPSAILLRRYWDAYLAAGIVVSVGKFVKIGGGIVGAGLGYGAFGMVNTLTRGSYSGGYGNYSSSESTPAMIVGGCVAICVAGAFFVLGVLIAAQGQLTLASLDTAVNSSPILTDEEKIQIICRIS